MVSIGRVACVALPFCMTAVSIIALMVAALAGITNKSLYMFQINTTDLTFSETDLESLLSSRSVDLSAAPALDTRSTNISASDLGIGKLYQIDIWNYCYWPQTGSRNCSSPSYNWASKTVNETEESFNTLLAQYDSSGSIPSSITKALSVFVTLSRWTQVVFAIAFAALGAELVVGFFGSCSRAISCLTSLVAMIASVAVLASAGMATGMAVAAVSVIDSTAKIYGAKGNINTKFLAAVWIAAAAAIAASFFWTCTVCCCSSDRGSRRRKDREMGAGAMPMSDKSTGYQPLNDPRMSPSYYNTYAPQTQHGVRQSNGRSDVAYEPYSHARV